jgi:hypothetical protein
MTKKDSRRRVLPTRTEPHWPQSTCAQHAGGKGEGEERRRTARTHGAKIVLQDRDAAVVAELAQPLQDLDGAVGVSLDQPSHGRLESIELAGARSVSPRPVVRRGEPGGDGARIKRQRACNLCDAQAVVRAQVADAAVRLVVDHRFAPIVEDAQNGGSSSHHSGC